MFLDAALDLLVCPRCREPLARRDGSVGCANGHAFDVARQGYLNLSSRPPPANADTAGMVAARVAFLAAGHFAALTEMIASVTPVEATTILDSGAGPGYYAAHLLRADPKRRAVALDVSVAAAKRAARAHERMAAVVADAWGALPVADQTIEIILSVFAPRNPPEFRRVLAPGGSLITVVPGTDHLVELREPLRLLDVQPAKTGRLNAALIDHFRSDAREVVTVRSAWDAHTARAAVLMGPNAFHLQPAELDRRLARLSWPLEVTVSCLIGRWTT